MAASLFGRHGAEFAAGDGEELGLVEGVVAAEEDDDGAELAELGVVGLGELGHVGHGLDLVLGLGVEEGADLVDGALAGGVDEFGLAVAGGGEVFDGGEAGWWPFRGWRRSRRRLLAMRSSPASV